MATVDLTSARDEDGFVVYFGGAPNEVDTYTFANALVALSDAFREINAQVNPGFALELRLESLSEGSFRAKVREKATTLAGALKFTVSTVVMPILVTYFYTHVIDPDKVEIIVNTDEVIIVKGRDRVVVPRAAYNAAQSLPNKAKVASQIARAVEAVENDPHVESFGVFSSMDGKKPPALLIERVDFAAVRAAAVVAGGNTRTVTEEATITILKAVMAKSDRKWEFVWKGIKICAAIRDAVFLADLVARKYLIGTGDALRVLLSIEQVWDESAQVWLNSGYGVQTVREFIPAAQTRDLDL